MARRESGFTLVEALIAIVVLMFGLVAIAQLFVVASQSNVTARRATAAANASSQVMDMLMAAPFDALATGGGVTDADMKSTGAPESFAVTNYKLRQNVPGVGEVLTCWHIGLVSGNTELVAIQVRSEAVGLMSALSRAEFTTLRAKVDRPGA